MILGVPSYGLKKLDELGIDVNLKQIICDFELNIHKAIDGILPWVEILGCFFHLAKAFKEKVDIKGMKRHYDKNPEFRKQAIALSSLPLTDIEAGLNWLKDNVFFDDEELGAFKTEFLSYIERFWINGCYPPYIWSTWKRTGEYTNNNQEGMNSKMNKDLKQHYPSPGILLCFVKKQITLAEISALEAKVGKPGPRQKVKQKKLAEKKNNLKENYEREREIDGINKDELLGDFLSAMGHNVASSTPVGRVTDQKVSEDPAIILVEDDCC